MFPESKGNSFVNIVLLQYYILEIFFIFVNSSTNFPEWGLLGVCLLP